MLALITRAVWQGCPAAAQLIRVRDPREAGPRVPWARWWLPPLPRTVPAFSPAFPSGLQRQRRTLKRLISRDARRGTEYVLAALPRRGLLGAIYRKGAARGPAAGGAALAMRIQALLGAVRAAPRRALPRSNLTAQSIRTGLGPSAWPGRLQGGLMQDVSTPAARWQAVEERRDPGPQERPAAKAFGRVQKRTACLVPVPFCIGFEAFRRRFLPFVFPLRWTSARWQLQATRRPTTPLRKAVFA